MKETVRLDFDDGFKNIQLGDDPQRVIRLNPTDTGFIKRFAALGDKAKEISERYGDIDLDSISELRELDTSSPDYDKLKTAAENIGRLDKALRELIDAAFGQPICDTVFGDTWCMSPVHGEPLYEHFLTVIGEYIASEVGKQSELSAEKIGKYTSAAKTVPKRAEK